jgi:DNA-binding transcriptional MocR family regulator
MKVPPFKLDLWLAAHEFATPPIRYNLASSTGPLWTFAELMSLGGGSATSLEDVRLSYAPPQGGKLLRERIATLHGVDPEQVLVMTGASEALIALICFFAGDGGSIVLPKPVYPAVPVLARTFGLNVREYSLRRELGFAQTAEQVLALVDDKSRAVFVNTPHNPTGSVMAVGEQRKLAEALAARSIPLIVDEVYHPLYFWEMCRAQARCPIPSCSATLPRRSPSRDCVSAGSSIATRSGARRCSTCAAISRFQVRRSPRRWAPTRWRTRP